MLLSWFLLLAIALGFYLACNLGANDVANSMGTSVGSKAVTLRQALVIAGCLEFAGAVLFGRQVSTTLATGVVNVDAFTDAPNTLGLGMLAVLCACGLWLNIATLFGLPVSSSHATVGAIAGFGWAALGPQVVDWPQIGVISLAWVLTPVVSGAISALLYRLVQRYILTHPDPVAQLREWIPWLSVLLVGSVGVLVLPTLSQPLVSLLARYWGLPPQDGPLLLGAIATLALTVTSWRRLEGLAAEPVSDATPQALLARFQVLSACCVAFAHGSNDVGNAIAPLAVIHTIQATGTIPLLGFAIPIWIFVVGGLGIVTGLALWGGRVIATIGEGIISLQPSDGFCAELATAMTVLIASRFGWPVSTSHALVGGVVGVALVHAAASIQVKTLRQVVLAWGVTVPVAAILGATFFWILQLIEGVISAV